MGKGALDGGGSGNDRNVVLGTDAGTRGSDNVLIGYQAGLGQDISNKLIITNTGSKALITGDFANNTLDISGSVIITDTVTAVTGSFSHLKGNSPITVQDPVIFQHDQGLDVLGNATVHSLNEVELQTISKNFNYTSSLNVAEITSSVEGAIIDYRLTSLNSGSRVGTFYYAHDGTTLSYNDLTVPGAGIGGDPVLSATLTGSIVSIDIENAAGFNFSGFAKKFNKLDNAIPVADPNISYLLNAYPSENYIVAYSIRQVNQLYTGSCMKVRRDSDNVELDIDFDVNGNLDTVAIEDFCGSSEGRVSVWYDQSGNDYHSTQSVAANQGLIYNGTSINTNNNGLPAISSNANNYNGPTGIDYSSGISMYQVLQSTGYNQYTPIANNNYGWGFIHSTYQDGFYVGNGSNNRRLANMDGQRNDNTLVLEAGLYDGTNVYAYMSQRDPYTNVSQPLATGTNTGGISTGNTTGWDMSFGRGRYQELIVLNEYNGTNRTGFFTNMNNYFDVNDTGLLVDHPGAAAAYSVRQLTTSFTSSMNIRRASDNAEQVIGFTSAGDLDTGSIETFCAGTECYVDTWYDQSGNENDAEQTNASNQPLIYSASAVITENNKPALEFTPSQQYSVGDYDTFNFIHQGDESCISVVTTYKSGKRIVWGSSFGGFQVGFGVGVDDRSGLKKEVSYIINQDNQTPVGVNRGDYPYMDSQSHHLVYHSGSHATAASRYISSVNGSPGPASGFNTSTITPATGSADALFKIPYTNQNPGNAIVQELIVWNSTPLSSSINSNINSYFNIY